MADLLDSFLAEEAKKPFIRGHLDCFTFAARWFKLVKGIDYSSYGEGRYSNEREAIAFIRSLGGASTFLSGLLGQPSVLPASRGDIGLLDLTCPHLMISCGKAWAVLTRDRGILYAPVAADLVWSIGFAG